MSVLSSVNYQHSQARLHPHTQFHQSRYHLRYLFPLPLLRISTTPSKPHNTSNQDVLCTLHRSPRTFRLSQQCPARRFLAVNSSLCGQGDQAPYVQSLQHNNAFRGRTLTHPDTEGRADEAEQLKQQQLKNQKEGKGKWEEGLASDSESIVRIPWTSIGVSTPANLPTHRSRPTEARPTPRPRKTSRSSRRRLLRSRRSSKGSDLHCCDRIRRIGILGWIILADVHNG